MGIFSAEKASLIKPGPNSTYQEISQKRLSKNFRSLFLHKGSWWSERTLKYSAKMKCLIMNCKDKFLKVTRFDGRKPKNSFKIPGEGLHIQEHEILGQEQDHVVVLRECGTLRVHRVDISKKRAKVVAETQIELFEKKEEAGCGLAVSPDSKYIAVSTWIQKSIASRMFLYELAVDQKKKKSLELRYSLDIEDDNLPYFRALEFSDYSKKNQGIYILSALTFEEKSKLITFGLNEKNGVFNELAKLYEETKLVYPSKIVKGPRGYMVVMGQELNQAILKYKRKIGKNGDGSGGCTLI